MFAARILTVDGLQTQVHEAGSGPTVVLLHSGEYGASAETSWSDLFPVLVRQGYHVIAPDWLGFGRSDKVVDFADPTGRRLRHLISTLKALDVKSAAFIGSSMGGTYLARMLSHNDYDLPAAVAVLVSGGGFVPDNEARRSILDYDLTEAGMARILRTLMHSPQLSENSEYVRWRHQLSLEPGAWQCAASARLRPPIEGAIGDFGRPDKTPYEAIRVPTLVIAGAEDTLRLPGYAEEFTHRIPDVELITYPFCGHLPNIEYPNRFAEDVLDFLDRRFRNT